MQKVSRMNFKSVAAIAASLALSFNTFADPPPKGSEQDNILKDYAGFIRLMHRYNKDGSTKQWCCNEHDGRGRLKEVRNDDGSFEVLATRKAFGPSLSSEEVWVHVPKESVLRPEDAEIACKEAKGVDKATACTPPPFNILWVQPGTAQANTSTGVYCYWPIPYTY